MNTESSHMDAFLNYLSQNENNETRQYSKIRLQSAYTAFTQIEANEKDSLSFATLQLRLKEEGKLIAEGRDELRFTCGFPGASSSTDVKLDVPQLFSSSVLPEFAANARFFLLEAENFEDVRESSETGRLIVTSEYQNTLNEAYDACDQVVILICVHFGNRLRGFCTMDSHVSKVEDLKNEWSSANLKADDLICQVSWERLGDYPIPVNTRIGAEVDAKKGRNICEAFYFERQSSIGEFKSPESAIETNHTDDHPPQPQKMTTNIPSMGPLIEAFSRCEEDKGENGEEFRRRSMDKLAAAAHYEMPPRKTGVVVKFSQQKGYGFIRPDYDYIRCRQLPDIFVHRTSIVSSNKVPNLRVGQKTEYDVTLDPRTGKPHAVNVTGPGRIPLDEIKIPVPTQILDRPPLYGHGARNVKTAKPWLNGGVRKMAIPSQMTAPSSANNTYSKSQENQAWSNSGTYSDKARTNKWETEKSETRFLPKEMNMTVTIDNDLPSNVSRYQHRKSPSPPSQVLWGQPQYTHNEYHNHYDPHRHGFKNQNGARQMTQDEYNNGRNWKVTSPAREVSNEYDNYGRQEYWRFEREIPQYDGDYRQMGYDYRYQRDYRATQNW